MAVKIGVVIVASPFEFKVMFWFEPPSTVYLTMALGVPFKLIRAEFPVHILVVPDRLTVG